MKDLIKFISIIASGLVGFFAPLYCFYSLWAWPVAQIPAAHEYAGMIKVGITIALLAVGGSATVAIAFLLGLAAFSISAIFLGK